MAALTDWVANIIVLILIAVIMELLIPNSSLQKYVKMVVGLLLILVLLSPLLSIFSVDEDDIFQTLSPGQTVTENDFENSINQKKSEIQAAQDAYIEEEMAVQMENQVEEELIHRFHVEISGVDLTLNDESAGHQDLIHAVHVRLGTEAVDETSSRPFVEPVQKVVIGEEKTQPSIEVKKMEDIRTFLANAWQIDEEKISLDMEGGEG